MHATTEEVFGAAFSGMSVPRVHNEEQLRESLEMAVGRVGGWCEMAVSL
jgi:hypothetical protein